MIDAATGAQTGDTVRSRFGLGAANFSDGTRATIFATTRDYVTHETIDTRVAIVNLTTGTQVGTTLTLLGSASPTYSADGSRAALTAREGDSQTGYTTKVVLVDAVTGVSSERRSPRRESGTRSSSPTRAGSPLVPATTATRTTTPGLRYSTRPPGHRWEAPSPLLATAKV